MLSLLLITACSNHSYETIVIRGSDTEVNMVLRLAETFMESDSSVSIAVTGGGSGTGIAALLNKKADIANSSRVFKPAETDLAQARKIEVIPIVFALDALTFVTHESLPLDSLSINQIQQIFTGDISNWKEIGGPNLPISLYGRQSNSGTFTYVQQNILEADYSANMKQMNGTAQIIESLKKDPAGIGYVGIGYILEHEGEVREGINVLRIQGRGQPQAVSPLIASNITSGKYQIVRPLYQYLDGLPSEKLKEFLLFELGPEGQRLINEHGYFPITQTQRQQNLQYLNRESSTD